MQLNKAFEPFKPGVLILNYCSEILSKFLRSKRELKEFIILKMNVEMEGPNKQIKQSSAGLFTCCFKKKPVENELNDTNNLQRLYSAPASATKHDSEIIKAANLPILWILAGPGAPIQAFVHRIAKVYNFHHIFIGEILEQELMLGTNRSEVAQQLMKRGIVLPRQFLIEIIKRDMAEAISIKHVKGFVFSDYPSTFTQAKSFVKKISPVDFVLVLKFDEKTMRINAFHAHRRQALASKRLSKSKDQLRKASEAEVKSYSKDLIRLYNLLGDRMKIIDGQLEIRDAYLEIMKWIERAMIVHNTTPPLLPDLPINSRRKFCRATMSGDSIENVAINLEV